MSIKKQIKKELITPIKHPKIIALGGLEDVVRTFGKASAVLSLGANPEYNVVERMSKGAYDAGKIVYDLIHAYVTNAGTRDTVNNQVVKALDLFGNMGYNIGEHPKETIAASLLALGLGYGISKLIELYKDSLKDKYSQ